MAEVKPLHPIDGQFVAGVDERAAACVAADHPLVFLNLSVSGKIGRNVSRCLCGVNDQAPAALREWKKIRREAARSMKADMMGENGK